MPAKAEEEVQTAASVFDVLSLEELERDVRFKKLIAPARFSSQSLTAKIPKDAKKATKTKTWNTAGNVFQLLYDLEMSLLKTLSSLILLQALEYKALLTARCLGDMSASSLVSILARHFSTSASPVCMPMFANELPSLVAPTVNWMQIRSVKGVQPQTPARELYAECIAALKRYAAARSAALRADAAALCADDASAVELGYAVVWLEEGQRPAIVRCVSIEEAGACFIEKSSSAVRMYSISRNTDGVPSLEILQQHDGAWDPAQSGSEMETCIHSTIVTRELATWREDAETPGREYYTVEHGTRLSYHERSPDFCNVLSAHPITSGRHEFEFLVHSLGDEMWCGVTCNPKLAGPRTSLRNVAKCWTYYCGNRHRERGEIQLSGDGATTAAHIVDGDVIGLVVDFPNRLVEFFKNGESQGGGCFPENVEELYLVTELDTPKDVVELRATGAEKNASRCISGDVSAWGADCTKTPGWLKKIMKHDDKAMEVRGEQSAGIGVAIILAQSLQQTASLTDADISELLEMLTCCFFLSSNPSQDVAVGDVGPKKRLTVGMKVRLTANYLSIPNSEAREGPLRPGVVAVLVQDDRSRNPYLVRFGANQRGHWYEEGTLEEAVDPEVKDDSLIHVSCKVLEAIKALMTCQQAVSLQPGPYLRKLIDRLRTNQLAVTSIVPNPCTSDLDFLLAFDRQQRGTGTGDDLEQLLAPWIAAKRKAAPTCAAQGCQQDIGPLWCCIALTQSQGRIPGKTDGQTCWYSYGGGEHETSDFELFQGQLFSKTSTGIEPQGHQTDGAGDVWCAVAHTAFGKIPGKAQAGTCWYPYNGKEDTTDSFEFVGLQSVGLDTNGAPEHGEHADSVETPPVLSELQFVGGLEGEYVSVEGSRIKISRVPSDGRETLVFTWKMLVSEDPKSDSLSSISSSSWDLIPEKVGENPALFSTMGLNVGSGCPFFDDGHQFLMLEWESTNNMETHHSVCSIHGPNGETFKPDTSKKVNNKHTGAVMRIECILKMRMCLEALESRRVFASWLQEHVPITDPPHGNNPAYNTLSPEDWEMAADNSRWSLEADRVLSRCGGIDSREQQSDDDAPVDTPIPAPGEGVLVDVSRAALTARLGILAALSTVLCKCVPYLNFNEYSRQGSTAHVLLSSTCGRVLIRSAMLESFKSGINAINTSATGEFPSFSVNRGILPADQRKRLDTVFCQTMQKIGANPVEYPLLATACRGVGKTFWEVTFEGEGGMDYGHFF